MTAKLQPDGKQISYEEPIENIPDQIVENKIDILPLGKHLFLHTATESK